MYKIKKKTQNTSSVVPHSIPVVLYLPRKTIKWACSQIILVAFIILENTQCFFFCNICSPPLTLCYYILHTHTHVITLHYENPFLSLLSHINLYC